MNHKRLIVGIGIALLLAIGIYLWVKPGSAVDQVLPKGPLAFVRFTHGDVLWNDFIQSDFYKKLSVIDVEKVLRRNNTDEKDIKDYQQLHRQWELLVDNPWIKRVISKEVVVALYEDAQKGIYPLLVIRLDHTLQAAKWIAHVLQPDNSQVEVSSMQYRGVTVNTVLVKKYKQTLFYVTIDNLLVMAQQDISFLDQVIDKSKSKVSALSDDAHYQFMKKQSYANSDADAFINMKALMNRFMMTSLKGLPDSVDQIAQFNVAALSFDHQQTAKFKFSMNVSGDLQQCPSNENTSISLVPATVIVYNWGNCYDFAGYWSKLKKNSTRLPFIEQMQERFTKGIKRHFGIEFESDLLPLIGREAGGYLTEIDSKALFPYPRGLMFVKVNDVVKTQQILEQFKAKLPMDLSQETYEGVEVNYFNLSVGANTDPGFCMVGDYLLLASSRQLLKKSIDTHLVPERSLAGDKTVKELGVMDGSASNAVSFVRTNAMIKRAKMLSDWADKLLASQVSMASTYHKEWDIRKLDFDTMIDEKKEELKAASERLVKIRQQDLETRSNQQEIIVDDIQRINSDIDELKSKKQDGEEQINAYLIQAEAAKLTMFNTANVLLPVLNALETIEAQSLKFNMMPHLFQTEIVVK